MVFEVQDLAVASPATVSRCGMVYIDSNELGWTPYVKTWIMKFKEKFGELYTEYLLALFEKYVDDGLNFVNKKCTQTMKQVDVGKVTTLCSLLESLLIINKDADPRLEEGKLKSAICTTFVFCYVWSIGGNLRPNNWDSFDTFVRNQFEENGDAKVKFILLAGEISDFIAIFLNNNYITLYYMKLSNVKYKNFRKYYLEMLTLLSKK